MAGWAATQAKAQFSAVLDKAAKEGPQLVTRRDERFLIMTQQQFESGDSQNSAKPFVSAWDALKPSFDERFDVDFPRLRGKTRKVDLE